MPAGRPDFWKRTGFMVQYLHIIRQKVWEMKTVSQIEMDIYELPLGEKLQLMERLARHLRDAMTDDIGMQLAAMACDAEIQSELRAIEKEFAVTEMNGLEAD